MLSPAKHDAIDPSMLGAAPTACKGHSLGTVQGSTPDAPFYTAHTMLYIHIDAENP